MTRTHLVGGRRATTLTGPMSDVATTLTVADATGWPDGTDGQFVIGVGRSATFEVIRCASRTGNTLTVAASGRGYDSSLAVAHLAGATVELVLDSITLSQLSEVPNSLTPGGLLAGGGPVAGPDAASQALLSDLDAPTRMGWGPTPVFAPALADGSVTADLIAPNAVSNRVLGTASVTASALALGSVDERVLGDASVTNTALSATLLPPLTLLPVPPVTAAAGSLRAVRLAKMVFLFGGLQIPVSFSGAGAWAPVAAFSVTDSGPCAPAAASYYFHGIDNRSGVIAAQPMMLALDGFTGNLMLYAWDLAADTTLYLNTGWNVP